MEIEIKTTLKEIAQNVYESGIADVDNAFDHVAEIKKDGRAYTILVLRIPITEDAIDEEGNFKAGWDEELENVLPLYKERAYANDIVVEEGGNWYSMDFDPKTDALTAVVDEDD